MATLNTDIRYQGVGEARAKSLAKLGITDLRSLLSYFPRAYDDRRVYKKIADLIPGENACVCAVIAGEPKLSRIRKGLDLIKLRAVDETGALGALPVSTSLPQKHLPHRRRLRLLRPCRGYAEPPADDQSPL